MKSFVKPGLLFIAICIATPIAFAKKEPFSGNWLSKQYTNGKEFQLKIQQVDKEIIGWEGRLPPNTDKLEPDFKGTVKGKEADIEMQHRRGYKAHAKLRIQGDKLVWQMLESDSRSNRYFPLASTLLKRDDDIATDSAQVAPANKSSDQLLWDILSHADSFDTANVGEGGGMSASFSAYKALLNHNPSTDDIGLQTLLKSDRPAARLYAAAMLWDLNHEAGLNGFKTLVNDNTVVKYKSGCEVMQTTVQDIARSFLEKGNYLDFPSKKY